MIFQTSDEIYFCFIYCYTGNDFYWKCKYTKYLCLNVYYTNFKVCTTELCVHNERCYFQQVSASSEVIRSCLRSRCLATRINWRLACLPSECLHHQTLPECLTLETLSCNSRSLFHLNSRFLVSKLNGETLKTGNNLQIFYTFLYI